MGRVAGYAALGALAAYAMDRLAWFSQGTSALRPIWTAMHIAIIAWGLMLVMRLQAPAWMERAGRGVWSRVKSAVDRPGGVLAVGCGWALMPCGFLYSAAMLAALSGGPLAGALAMSMFALASGLWLWTGHWGWLHFRERLTTPRMAAWGVRLSGIVLVALGATALWCGAPAAGAVVRDMIAKRMPAVGVGAIRGNSRCLQVPPDRHPEPGVQVGKSNLTLGSSDARRSRSSGDVSSPCSVSIGSRKYKTRQHRRRAYCNCATGALVADEGISCRRVAYLRETVNRQNRRPSSPRAESSRSSRWAMRSSLSGEEAWGCWAWAGCATMPLLAASACSCSLALEAEAAAS